MVPGRVENARRVCDVWMNSLEKVWKRARGKRQAASKQASKQASRQAGACHLAQRETRSQPRHVRLGGLYSASTETAVRRASKTFFRHSKANKSVFSREKTEDDPAPLSRTDERNEYVTKPG